jgi:hypothetical protein
LKCADLGSTAIGWQSIDLWSILKRSIKIMGKSVILTYFSGKSANFLGKQYSKVILTFTET